MGFLATVRRGFILRESQYIGARYRSSGILRSGGTGFDWVSSVGDPQANSTVAIGLQTIIDKIDQSGPLLVREIQGKEGDQLDEKQHMAFMSLISSPECTPKQFFKILATSCKLYGPAYVVAERVSRGVIDRLLAFPANQVKINPDGSYRIHRHGDKQVMTVDARDVIPILYGLPSPTDPLITIAPLQSLMRQIAADNSAATFMASVFQNSALMSIIVNPKESKAGEDRKVRKEKRDRIHDALTTFTGDRSGGIYIPPEPVDVHKVSMSPDEMKTTDTKRITITEILGALGVDPMVCALPSENRTFNNYAEARQSLIEDTILPLWAVILEPILEYLKQQRYLRGDVKLVPDLSKYPELKKKDKELADTEATLFKGNITTRAQALKRLGIDDSSKDERLFAEIMLSGKAGASNQLSARAKAAIERLRAIHDEP